MNYIERLEIGILITHLQCGEDLLDDIINLFPSDKKKWRDFIEELELFEFNNSNGGDNVTNAVKDIMLTLILDNI
tara:strand:- start:682 stop:906 length:225 start_codon:yes stop_codon:yes gene_type:complete